MIKDYVSGADVLTEVITQNRTLTHLDLSWNFISKKSAVALAKALSYNSTLTALNISHNNIGDLAGQWLAHSLRYNLNLTRLDVSYNAIEPRGISVFIHMLGENTTLKYLNLNGNIVGTVCCRQLKHILRERGRRKNDRNAGEDNSKSLEICFSDANLTYQDSSLFSASAPSGKYSLTLDDPYDYMCADYIVSIGECIERSSKIVDMLSFTFVYMSCTVAANLIFCCS